MVVISMRVSENISVTRSAAGLFKNAFIALTLGGTFAFSTECVTLVYCRYAYQLLNGLNKLSRLEIVLDKTQIVIAGCFDSSHIIIAITVFLNMKSCEKVIMGP